MNTTWAESIVTAEGSDIVHLDCTEGEAFPRLINTGNTVAQACGLGQGAELRTLDWGVREGMLVKLKVRRLRHGTVLKAAVHEPETCETACVEAQDYSMDKVLHRLNMACQPLVARMTRGRARA